MQSIGGAPGPKHRPRTVGAHGPQKPTAELPRMLSAGRRDTAGRGPTRSWARVLGSLIKLTLLMAVITVAGLGVLGKLPAKVTEPLSRLDQTVIRTGLGITHVAVTGNKKSSLDEIYAAIGLDKPKSFLTFDTRAARARIERLAWVKRARMIHILPDMLAVEITERQPHAVWQRRGMLFLMDREGRVLEPVAPDSYVHLPMFVGEGAAKAAPELLAALSKHRSIERRLAAMVRVATRRWTLKLKDGMTVHLPAGKAPEALAQLAGIHARKAILDRALDAIDLRVPGQVVVRLQGENAVRRRRAHALRLRTSARSGNGA